MSATATSAADTAPIAERLTVAPKAKNDLAPLRRAWGSIRKNRQGGLSSALIVVGVLALFGFIFSLELSRAIGTPVDTPLLEIGIALIVAGGVGWVLYQRFMNDVF